MRLLHTMFMVTDLERSTRFYTEVFGMTVLRKQEFPQGRFSLVFLGYGPETENTVLEITHNWDTDAYTQGNAYGHIAIQCDDLEATCENVRTSEGELSSEPKQMTNGPIMAFARDPDGYSIEILGEDCLDFLSTEA